MSKQEHDEQSEASTSAAADVMRLTWSEQSPSKEGWCWYREEGCEKKAIQVEEAYGFYNFGRMRVNMKYNSCYWRWADEAPGEWAGPIPEPKNAA